MAVEDLVLVAFMAYITRVWKVYETVKEGRCWSRRFALTLRFASTVCMSLPSKAFFSVAEMSALFSAASALASAVPALASATPALDSAASALDSHASSRAFSDATSMFASLDSDASRRAFSDATSIFESESCC